MVPSDQSDQVGFELPSYKSRIDLNGRKKWELMKKFKAAATWLFVVFVIGFACSVPASCEDPARPSVARTPRIPAPLTASKNWVEATEIGVDCTGAVDSARAIQTAVDADPSLHLLFPSGCSAKIGSTITVTSGTGTSFKSANFPGDGVGTPAKLIWVGTKGVMFDFEHSDHPVVENLVFVSPGGANCPDGFLKFDGDPGGGQIGTNGRIIGNSFSNGSCNNANFIGVSISPTATNNHENYIVQDNYISCGGGMASVYAHDGVTNGTTTLTSASALFSAGDVGKRIRISYAGGLLDTTIATFANASSVLLAAPAPWSQSNVTVVVGTSYGIGYRNGASQNALQQQFIHLQYSRCAVGILFQGGNGQIVQASGGQSDIGIQIGGFVAQNTLIDFYASESDFQAIVLISGNVAPITITNSRFSNGNQMASGHVILCCKVTFVNNLFNFNPQSNAVLIGASPGGNPTVTSINNDLRGLSWTRIGYGAFTSPTVTSINDELDQSTNPAQQMFGCWNISVPCFGVTNSVSHGGGTALKVTSGNVFANAKTAIVGLEAISTADFILNYTAIRGVGTPNRFAGSQIAVEAAWDVGGISGAGASGGPVAAYAFRARTPASVSATLPALYGIYIDKQKVTNVSAGWGVYQADPVDQNYFGGPVLMQKNPPTLSAPGTGAMKIEVVCGTNPGTARLQAYAGTSVTPTTILDNVGAGVSGC